MRKNRRDLVKGEFTILAVDDDPIMTETLQSYFQRSGYEIDTENDPIEAIEDVRNGNYDILMLDFLMGPINGDEVVRRVREFNQDICIFLLTGHKEIVPPLKTMRELDIQGYFEKSERFDQLEMMLEANSKQIKQIKTIKKYQKGLTDMSELLAELSRGFTSRELAMKISEILIRLFNSKTVLTAFGIDGSMDKPYMYMCPSGDLTAFDRDTSAKDVINAAKSMIPTDSLYFKELFSPTGDRLGLIMVDFANVNLGAKSDSEFEEQRFDIFSRQCSSVIENNLLLNRVRDSNIELVKAIRIMVDAKDENTRGHSDRVSMLSEVIAKVAGLDEKTIQNTKVAGLFHDIGKVGVPDSILLSPRKLTPEERQEIQKHTEQGAKILSEIPVFAHLAPIVLSHHERVDGHGYPNGLQDKEIPEESKIIAVADTYDALISRRSYKDQMSKEETIKILLSVRGKQLDPKYTDILVYLLNKSDGGLLEGLNTEQLL